MRALIRTRFILRRSAMSSTLASPEVDKLGIQEPQTSSNPVEATTETLIQTKNEKDSEKTRKKAEKAKKFAAKQKPAPGAASAKTATKKSLPPAVLEFTEQTPPGQKKILRPFSDDNDITKAYNPKAIESAWGAWWEAQGFFTPSNDTSSKSSFTIVIPPPNITVRWPLPLGLYRCLQIAGKVAYWSHAGHSASGLSNKMESYAWDTNTVPARLRSCVPQCTGRRYVHLEVLSPRTLVPSHSPVVYSLD